MAITKRYGCDYGHDPSKRQAFMIAKDIYDIGDEDLNDYEAGFTAFRDKINAITHSVTPYRGSKRDTAYQEEKKELTLIYKEAKLYLESNKEKISTGIFEAYQSELSSLRCMIALRENRRMDRQYRQFINQCDTWQQRMSVGITADYPRMLRENTARGINFSAIHPIPDSHSLIVDFTEQDERPSIKVEWADGDPYDREDKVQLRIKKSWYRTVPRFDLHFYMKSGFFLADLSSPSVHEDYVLDSLTDIYTQRAIIFAVNPHTKKTREIERYISYTMRSGYCFDPGEDDLMAFGSNAENAIANLYRVSLKQLRQR